MSIYETYLVFEKVSAWGLSIVLATLFLVLYILTLGIDTHGILKKNKIMYLYLMLFFFNLSTMPLLLLSNNYEAKRYFEIAGTILLVLNIYAIGRFVIDFVKSLTNER